MVIGAIFWAEVLASFCDIHTTTNPDEHETRRTIDQLNRFMAQQNVPTEVRDACVCRS